MKYHFLMSYLPDLSRDQTRIRFTPGDLVEEKFHIQAEDWAEIELVLLRGDVQILARLLAGKTPPEVRSLHGANFWREQIKARQEGPKFLLDVLDDLEPDTPAPAIDELLFIAYYGYVASQARTKLLADFIQLEWDLRNIMAALRARRKGLEPAGRLAGDTEVAAALSSSRAGDFGLGKDFPWIETLAAAVEPLEIQEAQEKILWEHLDESIGADPFAFEALLAYALKLQILEDRLSRIEDRGLELLRGLEAR